MYIISENTYFSRGLYELLKNSKEQIENIPFSFEVSSAREFMHGDVILLVMEDLYLLDKIIPSLPSYVVVIIFIGKPRFYFFEKKLNLRKDNELLTCMSPESILSALQLIIVNNKTRHDFNSLTTRERIIMNGLVNGVPVWQIASRLGLDVKTISTYKMSSLRKLGLLGMNARALYIYKIISMTKKFAVCVYESMTNLKSSI